jgi:hypothetical protein
MASHEDAVLLVQLLRWGTELGIENASKAVLSESFDPKTASVNDESVARLLEFGEGVGTLCKHSLLDRALVQDTWAIALVWTRLEPAARRQRERFKEPRLYENFEALATSELATA